MRTGVGLFAAVLKARFPALPIEEEGRLQDPVLRENFIERVFAYDRLRELFDGRWTLNASRRVSHRAQDGAARALDDRLPGTGPAGGRRQGARRAPSCARRYEAALHARRWRARRRRARHTNVLMHMAGHLEKDAGRRTRSSELVECIDEYRRELVPLVVPLTLLRHHVRAHGVAYLAGQTYLEPHPRELMLRNHV